MTIFDLIEDNVLSLLDGTFLKDKECGGLSDRIRELEKSSEEIQNQLLDDNSVLGKYVELLNQRCARMNEISYKKGIRDVIDFLHIGNRPGTK